MEDVELGSQESSIHFESYSGILILIIKVNCSSQKRSQNLTTINLFERNHGLLFSHFTRVNEAQKEEMLRPTTDRQRCYKGFRCDHLFLYSTITSNHLARFIFSCETISTNLINSRFVSETFPFTTSMNKTFKCVH